MILKLHGLRNRGQVEITAEKDPADYQLDQEEFDKPLQIRVILQDSGDIVDCNIVLVTSSRKICDRCTRDFDYQHRIEWDLIFIPEQHRDWSSKDDAVFYHPDNPIVDITSDIHDALVLDVPMKIICREDCRGLCPGCGTDLNSGECTCAAKPADPRFAALAELKKKMQTD